MAARMASPATPPLYSSVPSTSQRMSLFITLFQRSSFGRPGALWAPPQDLFLVVVAGEAGNHYEKERILGGTTSRQTSRMDAACIGAASRPNPPPFPQLWRLFRHDRRVGVLDIGHAKQILGRVDQPIDDIAEAAELGSQLRILHRDI